MTTEEHWCQKCWLSKRTVYHAEINNQWLCEQCFDHIVTAEIEKLTGAGIVERTKA